MSGVGVDPVALLRAAADRIAALSGAVTPGPWEVREEHGRDFTGEGWSMTLVMGGERHVAEALDDAAGDGDETLANAAWIAAMHPGVAAPLATWLRSEARRAARGSWWWVQEGDVENAVRDALEFARLILPGEPTDATGSERPATAPLAAETGAQVVREGSGAPTGRQEAVGGDRQ